MKNLSSLQLDPGLRTTAALLAASGATAFSQPAFASTEHNVRQKADNALTHKLGSTSTAMFQQAEQAPLATTAQLQECIDKTVAYTYTEYSVAKRALYTTAVVRSPAKCAAITDVNFTLLGSQKVQRGTRGNPKSKIAFISKPVEIKGVEDSPAATIAQDANDAAEQVRRAEKRAIVVVSRAPTKRTAKTYGMTTKHQVVPRNPTSIDPASGTTMPSPVGREKTETTWANPWLITPAGAKRSTKKPSRMPASGELKYMDNCNLLAGLSHNNSLKENSKYMKARLIPGPHKDHNFDAYVVKFKGAKLCERGGFFLDEDRKNYSFEPNAYTRTWARFTGGYLPNGKEILQLAYFGLVDNTRPFKFAREHGR